LEDAAMAASYGRQIPKEEAKPTEKFVRQFNYPSLPSIKSWNDISRFGIKTFFFSNVCSGVRKEEFERLGGFPEDLIMFEDMLFAARLLENGYSIAYAPEAEVIHSHDYSCQQYFKRYAKAGISFSNNPWFLKHAKAGGEGFNLFREEVGYFLREGMYYWCLYAFIDAAFKYIGFNLGLRYRSLPRMMAQKVIRYLNE
jgi:rhamnosyltransferase